MHLHGRHGEHHTLQTPLKQAGQSLARRPDGKASEAFPYNTPPEPDSLGFTEPFVNIALQGVTQDFHFRHFCRTPAN
jgi:hypothetical protein